jgi:HAD superfamily hydrolase (TIGR01509 family)
MKNFDGIIFDIDGTLTSTNELIYASFNHIAKKYLNKTFSNEEIAGFFGPPEDVIIKDFCGDRFGEGKKDYYSFYTKNHNMADLYPGIINILKDLKKKNVYLSIYTGKGKEAATITLKKLEIFDYFNLIITGDDVKEHKPSPEGINIFIEKFNLNRNRVLMIGDSTGDVKAARHAEVKIASVVWDSYAKEKVIKMNADYIFHTVDELKEFLENN